MPRLACLLVFILSVVTALPAQRRVDPRYSYHRVVAVVPLVASGATKARPKYIPTQLGGAGTATGIMAFAWQLSDDGKHAKHALANMQNKDNSSELVKQTL